MAVFKHVGLRIERPDDVPCEFGECVINLVVDILYGAINPRIRAN